MIRRIDSSLPLFKRLSFTPGLNVLLAQKSPGATDRQSRNGVGKTSLVEILNFLMGGDLRAGSVLKSPVLAEAGYSMCFQLGGADVEIERAPATPTRVVVKSGSGLSWPRQPALDVKVGEPALSSKDWKIVLGQLMFGLPDPVDEPRERFAPSFRSLVSYFMRRQSEGGFQSPQQFATKQQPYDAQVSLSYLLGLDPVLPQAFQELRQREGALEVFRKAAKDGAFGELVGKASDLRTTLAVQQARITKLRDQLSSFQVVPQYREYEAEATRITGDLAELARENQIDLEAIAQLEEAVKSERPPRFAEVSRAYEELGLVLPELVEKRFEDVERFHASVVENRRSHLSAEMDLARRRIDERERKKVGLVDRRAQLMRIMESGRALEHFSQLQTEVTRMEAQAETLRNRFEAAETLELRKADLSVERAQLQRRLKDDHHERKDAIEQAILVFEDLSNELYEREGSLTVSDTANGPTFEVRIEAGRSKGINNMQIFCFDMMLMELCIRRGRSPGFLVHDSHLFDGVDERQVARALEIGAARAERLGFQYIVTMNEDAVPRSAFHAGFDFDAHVNAVRLTDASDTGGLFGRRFE